MTVALRRETCRHLGAGASSRAPAGPAASSSLVWAAAKASSAIDGGLALPTRSPAPIMSTGKNPQASSPVRSVVPTAAGAWGRHRGRVWLPSCQAKSHW
ncbi:MAG: hypothetical protein QOF84_6878 [Streptomyces sp.]|nr:hypothetical protein [Streptomyces sp.]